LLLKDYMYIKQILLDYYSEVKFGVSQG